MKEYEKLELEKWGKLALVCIARKDRDCRITGEGCDIKSCIFYQWSNNGIQSAMSS
jgi:hypothetical protein